MRILLRDYKWARYLSDHIYVAQTPCISIDSLSMEFLSLWYFFIGRILFLACFQCFYLIV